MSSPHPQGCPACGATAPLKLVEDHLDRIGGRPYRLFLCPACGVVSTEPREAVGAEWYAKERPTRHQEARPPAAVDWRFRQFFSDRVPPGRLLDIGCGDGGFMSRAAERGFSPTGFDYDARMVALARERGIADAHAMEFSTFVAGRKPEEFDVATFFDVLEHTPEPAWFFAAVARLVKPGGWVAITLPNAQRPLPWGREEHDFPPHHFTRWTPSAMRGFLERQGFDVVRQEARTLKLSYLSDHCFFYWLMPRALKIARRLLFGRAGAAQDATITELYGQAPGGAPGALGDKLLRQRLVNVAGACFRAAFVPFGLALKVYCRVRQPECGDCLYTLARKRP